MYDVNSGIRDIEKDKIDSCPEKTVKEIILIVSSFILEVCCLGFQGHLRLIWAWQIDLYLGWVKENQIKLYVASL